MINVSFPSQNEDINAIWDRVLQQAHSDDIFRQQLLAHPESTLRYAGIEVPEDVKIIFHEFNLAEQHIFLPPRDVQLGDVPVTSIGVPKQDQEQEKKNNG